MGLKVKGIVCQTDIEHNAQAIYTCTPLFGAGPSSWLNLQFGMENSGMEIPLQEKSPKTTPPSLPSYIELGSQNMLSQSHFREKVKY